MFALHWLQLAASQLKITTQGDTDTVAKTEAGDLTLKLVTSGDTKNTVTVKTTKHQTSHKMLTGGFLSVDDLTAQYQSGGVGHVQVIHCRPRVNQGQDRQILEEQNTPMGRNNCVCVNPPRPDGRRATQHHYAV
ncbi:hypothetical protein LSAT2_025634 [Lamellibrachia satsuma]|nr:hypothetical protein LSAT2_025634 [Lamellibrachia satsuma]